MLAGSQREEMSLVGEALPDHRRREEGKLLSGPVMSNLMAAGPEVAQCGRSLRAKKGADLK
jgi:hypothetical protein